MAGINGKDERHEAWPAIAIISASLATRRLMLTSRAARTSSISESQLAAGALFTVIEHVSDHDHYCLSDEQIEGVHQAMAQADRGEFATDRELKEIFGRLP